MIKWAGVALTLDQVFTVLRHHFGPDADKYKDMTQEHHYGSAVINLRLEMRKRFEWFGTTTLEEGGEKRLFLARKAYEREGDTYEDYEPVPITKAHVPFLSWLVRSGLTIDEVQKQWMTIPDPTVPITKRGQDGSSVEQSQH